MELVDMTTKYYVQFEKNSIVEYASEKIKAGTWDEKEALINAKREFEVLIPQGLKTPDHYFYLFKNNDHEIGHVWFAKESNEKKVFIYDILIKPEFQNQGLGTETMGLIMIKARKLGFEKIGLHVFGHNQRALHVYQKVGFIPVDIRMERDL